MITSRVGAATTGRCASDTGCASVAATRDHARFGTGHLLLGLVRAEGREAGLLAVAGVTVLSAGAALSMIASSSVAEPVEPCGDHDPVADTTVAEVLEAAAEDGEVTAAGLLTALLARPWGQAAEMLAALGVEPGQLATAATEIAVRPTVTPRPMPRDPSGLLSAAWRRPEAAETVEA
jgi:ATP-dependent Clp protease ATP-binding subunit ClpA